MLATAVAAIVLVAIAGLCWSTRHAEHLTFSIPTEPASHNGLAAATVTEHEHAVRRVAAVFEQLNLPLARRISLHLYGSVTDFSRGLIEQGRLSPSMASRVVGFAAGVSLRETLLLLEPESRRGSRAWVRLLAHEMTHLSHAELAGGEGRGARWLSEGMADWVAFTVLDRLDIAPIEVERCALLAAGRRLLGRDDAGVDLERLTDPVGFLAEAGRLGVIPVYRLSFLLADYLIERDGLDRLIHYFRAFTTRADEAGNFEAAFGQSVADFEREVRRSQGDAHACPTSLSPVDRAGRAHGV